MCVGGIRCTSSQHNAHNTELRVLYPWHPWAGRIVDIREVIEKTSGHVARCSLSGEELRTAVNTEAKYLLLRHAFEQLGCIRVQLRTDLRNERSQKAIERIGGVREGVLRNHMILPDGSYRHSVYFSVIDTEWPAVKTHLDELLVR